jgi:plasmid stability protein
LGEGTQKALKHRAVDHGVSFEAELRAILTEAAGGPSVWRQDSADDLFAAAARFREATADIGSWQFERLVEYPDEGLFV